MSPPSLTWDEAVKEYLLHLQATRARKTFAFKRSRLAQLSRWAESEKIPFPSFGKRHLDRCLVFRADKGTSPMTLHHDAVTAKAFFRWCVQEELIEKSLLDQYQVKKAPEPFRYLPTEEDVDRLMAALTGYWSHSQNPSMPPGIPDPAPCGHRRVLVRLLGNQRLGRQHPRD